MTDLKILTPQSVVWAVTTVEKKLGRGGGGVGTTYI